VLKVQGFRETDPGIPHDHGHLLAIRRPYLDMDLPWLSRRKGILEGVGDQLGETQSARNGGIRGEADRVGLEPVCPNLLK
jgi:hypothetical protein